MPSFSFFLLTISEENFEYFFENLPFMSPHQLIKSSDLDKSHMKHGGLLNRHFCKKRNQISPMPYLKSPHHTCGTPHNICGTPQVHVEFLRNPCGIPQCFAELRKGFTTCGICSTSHIGIFSASIWKICGKFRLSFFT